MHSRAGPFLGRTQLPCSPKAARVISRLIPPSSSRPTGASGAESAPHPGVSGPGRGPACSRSARRAAGATGARHSPLTRPAAALTPSPRVRGTAPDSPFLPAARPALPRGPGRPSPLTCSIAWPGTPLNRIRPLRVPNRTRRLLEPTRSCRDPQVPAPSLPAHWLSASRGLYAPLLLALSPVNHLGFSFIGSLRSSRQPCLLCTSGLGTPQQAPPMSGLGEFREERALTTRIGW